MGGAVIRTAVVKSNTRHDSKPESRTEENTIVDKMSNETDEY